MRPPSNASLRLYVRLSKWSIQDNALVCACWLGLAGGYVVWQLQQLFLLQQPLLVAIGLPNYNNFFLCAAFSRRLSLQLNSRLAAVIVLLFYQWAGPDGLKLPSRGRWPNSTDQGWFIGFPGRANLDDVTLHPG